MPVLQDTSRLVVAPPLPLPENQGWVGAGFVAPSGRTVPDAVNIRLEYTLAPLAEPETIIAANSLPNVLRREDPAKFPRHSPPIETKGAVAERQYQAGQTPENRTVVGLLRRVHVQLEAITRFGQTLHPVGSGASVAGGGQIDELFEFDAPFSDIKEFHLRQRPVYAVEFKNVRLRPQPVASGGTQPTAASVALGPVIERRVELDQVIDFDTGRVISLPDSLKGSLRDSVVQVVLAAVDWMEREHMDAFLDEPHLFQGVGMKVEALENDAWDKLTAEAVRQRLAATPSKRCQKLNPGENKPATYAFQTRKGGLGILQVLGFDESTRQNTVVPAVKLRYKLVQTVAGLAPAAAPGTAASLPQAAAASDARRQHAELNLELELTQLARLERLQKSGAVAQNEVEQQRVKVAQLEAAKTKGERIALYEKMVENLRRLEEVVEAAHKAGVGLMDDVLDVTAARLEAEARLANEKKGDGSAAAPDLSTPKGAAIAFAKAIEAGELDAARSLSVGSDAGLALPKSVVDMARAANRLQAAARKRFGADGDRLVPPPPYLMKGLAHYFGSLEEKIEGDRATLVSKTEPGDTHLPNLKKVGDAWKMDLAAWCAGAAAETERNQIVAEAMDVLANALEGGECKSVEEAQERMGKMAEQKRGKHAAPPAAPNTATPRGAANAAAVRAARKQDLVAETTAGTGSIEFGGSHTYGPVASVAETPAGSATLHGKAKLSPGTLERLQWGVPVNGLRAALARPQALDKPDSGEIFDFDLVVQNVSDAPLRFDTAYAVPDSPLLSDRKNLSAYISAKPCALTSCSSPARPPCCRSACRPSRSHPSRKLRT